MKPLKEGVIGRSAIKELSDIVAGKVSGRSSPDVVTIFESQALAMQDVAVSPISCASWSRPGLVHLGDLHHRGRGSDARRVPLRFPG